MAETHAVWLTITGTDESGDAISLRTRGELLVDEESFSLRYEEAAGSDSDGALTFVECDEKNGRITVSRTGSLLTTIVYEEQQMFVGAYQTPVGELTLSVYAIEVGMERDTDYGMVHLLYQISMANSLSVTTETATRRLDIRFAPCKP